MEDAEVRFFEKVVDGFSYCAKKEPDKFVIVDGKDSVEHISDKIFSEVIYRMEKLEPVRRRIAEGEEEHNAS